MHYNEIKQGYFIARPNRFIAHIELDGQVEVCHVKNTGRCRELLTPRAVVYVECHHDPRRKTKYSLIAVRKGSMLVNMDSQAPNKVVGEWLDALLSNMELLSVSTKELQAESVAYVVSKHLGLDTSNKSFGYLASWSEDKETLKDLKAQLNKIGRASCRERV